MILTNNITTLGWKYIYSKLFKLNTNNSIFFNPNDKKLNSLFINTENNNEHYTQTIPSLKETISTGVDKTNNICGIKLVFEIFPIDGNNTIKELYSQDNNDNKTYLKQDIDTIIPSENRIENITIDYSIQIPKYYTHPNTFIDDLLYVGNHINNMYIYLGTGAYIDGATTMDSPKVQIPLSIDDLNILNDGSLLINIYVDNPNTSYNYTEFGIGYYGDIDTDKIELVYYQPMPSLSFSDIINFDFNLKIKTDDTKIYSGTYNVIQVNEEDLNTSLDKQLKYDLQPNEIGLFSYVNSNNN